MTNPNEGLRQRKGEGARQENSGSLTKNAGAVNKDDKYLKRKRRENNVATKQQRTIIGGAVFSIVGLCAAFYAIFHNNEANHSSLVTRITSKIFPLKNVTNNTLGDGPVPRPKNWHLWGYFNFKDNFNCSGYLNDGTKPVPSMEYWETMLAAYNQVVDPTYKFDDEIPPTQGYRLNEDGGPPYYAKLSPGKGRGLFATRDIKKGEMVHNGTKSDVVFPNETAWKRFMFALPRKMACDNAEWTFTQQFEEDGPVRIVSSLNIAILMNEGDSRDQMTVQPEDGNGNSSEYSSVFYAVRDIKKDEEILMDYADYDTDYEGAGLAELYLSVLSCTSFETCSVSELWYLIGHGWIFNMVDHSFMIKILSCWIVLVSMIFYLDYCGVLP